MARESPNSERTKPKGAPQPPIEANAPRPSDTPLSLSRLRAAFAQMLSAEPAGDAAPPQVAEAKLPRTNSSPRTQPAPADPCEISPRSVREAMLFVGPPDDRSLSSREVAAAMRGVSPAEVESAVAQLNADYVRDSAPYEIVGSPQGYRLALSIEYQRMRDKFHGRLKEARLSAAAIEVLSIVAYNQPTTVEAISELRAAPSGSLVASLVRRKLVRMERPAQRGQPTQYWTTDRFLQHFRLDALAALPRSEELEKV